MALRLRDGKCSIASVADPAPIEGLEVLPRHARRRPGGLARQRAGSLLSGLFVCSVDLEMLPHRGKRLLDAVLDVVVRRELMVCHGVHVENAIQPTLHRQPDRVVRSEIEPAHHHVAPMFGCRLPLAK